MPSPEQRIAYDIGIARAIAQENLNAYVTLALFDDLLRDGPLGRYTYFAKDNFCTRNGVTTGGSAFLFDFVAGYDATAIARLNDAGAVMLGKANMDEFGLGGTGTFGLRGPVLNPHDKQRAAGGSSSGSAALVAAKVCEFALGTDTGDSIRRPASYCGVLGFKPSYGLVSRYGVFPYAPSLDHVGLFASHLQVLAEVLDVIVGFDAKDGTSSPSRHAFAKDLVVSRGRLVVIHELEDLMTPEVKTNFAKTIAACEAYGMSVTRVSFSRELLDALLPTYNILSYAEAVSCYSNLTGLPFGAQEAGTFEQAARRARTANFGKELKRRFMIGAYCTSAANFEGVFQKTKKVRTLIVAEFARIMANADGLLVPAAPDKAPLISEIDAKFGHVDSAPDVVGDILLLGNFTGAPSLTVPSFTIDGLPWGVNVTAKIGEDQQCLNLGAAITEAMRLYG